MRLEPLDDLHGPRLRRTRDRATGKRGRQEPRDGHVVPEASPDDAFQMIDRKSTRLNSSHLVISYAVFCLKKKNRLPFSPGVKYGDLVFVSGQRPITTH